MKKIVLGCFVTGAMAIAACSSSSNPCSTFLSASTQLATLDAPCLGDAGTTAPTDGGSSVTACENAYGSSACTSSDQTELTTVANNFNTCVNGIAACTTATAAAFGMSVETCEAPISALAASADGGGAVSATCLAAIGPTIGY